MKRPSWRHYAMIGAWVVWVALVALATPMIAGVVYAVLFKSDPGIPFFTGAVIATWLLAWQVPLPERIALWILPDEPEPEPAKPKVPAM